jgi:hypothetical protein
MVRIGTYGDGAAVPSYIWDSLISQAHGHTIHLAEMSYSAASRSPPIPT